MTKSKFKILPRITEYQKAISALFAEEFVRRKGDFYARREQYDIHKIQSDMYRGKIAELLVYDYLVSNGKIPAPVEMVVLTGTGAKYFFNADIHCEGVNIHVKSSIEKNGFSSWVFEKKDALVSKPTPNDYIALVTLPNSESNPFPRLKIISALDALKRGLFKDLQNKQLTTKTAIYEKDI